CQYYWYDTDCTHLPRVLLVGDSIVVGQRDVMSRRMQGRVAISAFSTSKMVGDPGFIRELELAFSDEMPDLVIFNNTLHGFDYDDAVYRDGLEATFQHIRRKYPVELVWRSGTPVTEYGNLSQLSAEKNVIVVRRNAIAAEICGRTGIQIIDMYSGMLERPELRHADGYHYLQEGYEEQVSMLEEFIGGWLQANRREYPVGKVMTSWPGKISMWHGYRRHDFTINGVPSVLVEPNSALAEGNPWFWRMHFFGAFPNADWKLLAEGWTVAHINVSELYANQEAQRRFDALYEFMTAMGYAEKTVPVGYSRGGLDAYSWSARNPEKVACLYADNPVCDIKSWPCSRDSREWEKYKECAQRCLDALGLTPETLESYRGNPLDPEILKPIADAGIPVLHLLAEADEVVPAADNTDALLPVFASLGGQITVIRKPGCLHHPHCLEEPSPITEFVKGAFYSARR
ncbi:MAG: hypothetical protein J6S21_00850, partial [Victivallales bacterium]|nr:hypothetical protein [Victivallales bacterium]